MTRITKENIDEINDQLLRVDAQRYVEIYEKFLKAVEDSGVEIAPANDKMKRDTLLKKLEEIGASVKNSGKSIVLNAVSPSCLDCRQGVGSSTYILTLSCNRDCFFCTNKNQMGYEEGINKIFDVVADFRQDFASNNKMTSTALTGGEPLLYPDKCAEFIKAAKKKSKNIQTRIYTNGDLATSEILLLLKNAGLDEIRFGVKQDEEGNISYKILQTIEDAVKYIPRVMVEMPISPGTLESMKDFMIKLDSLNIFGVNILEFLYPWVNPDEYALRKYKISRRPYDVLYGYSYAGGLPVDGSEEECMELLLYCAEKGIKMGMHYCSLQNKLTAQIYQENSSIELRGTEYFSDKDFFIKSAKGYGNNIQDIKKILDENGCNDYIYNLSEKFIEFSPIYIKCLKNLDIELGLSYMAADTDEEGRRILRELQIDVLRPALFREQDI